MNDGTVIVSRTYVVAVVVLAVVVATAAVNTTEHGHDLLRVGTFNNSTIIDCR